MYTRLLHKTYRMQLKPVQYRTKPVTSPTTVNVFFPDSAQLVALPRGFINELVNGVHHPVHK
jgi:hypothetical protein